MNKLFDKYFLTLVFGFMGIVFFAIGLSLFWAYVNTQQESKLAAEIPLVNAAQLLELPTDTDVAIEAKISERNTSHKGLVIYTIFQYRGIECDEEDRNDCKEVWLQTERVTPAVWLDAPDGRIKVGNDDYWAYNEPEIWQTTDTLIELETLEYRGFRMGSPVFIIGTVNKNDGVTINADFLFGGKREDYLKSQNNQAIIFLLIGGIFATIGGIFIFTAVMHFIKIKTRA